MGARKKRALVQAESEGPCSGPEVLLLGEANFSFALALAALLVPPKEEKQGQQALAPDLQAQLQAKLEEGYQERLRVASAYLHLPPDICRNLRITATCYETYPELVEKYPEAAGILSRLRAFEEWVEVRFAVDALRLAECFKGKWDVVAWNHPHLGTEDLKLHGYLMAHFLNEAVRSLRPNGVVVLALLEGQEKRWELLRHASTQGFDVREAGPFETAAFPGYECKRNSSGKSFKNSHVQRTTKAPMESWLYHLHLGALDSRDSREAEELELQAAPEAARPSRQSRPSHKPESSAVLRCTECGKVFSCTQGLKTHVRQVHELKKYDRSRGILSCQTCGRAFQDSEALTQHNLAAHSGDSVGRSRPKVGYGYDGHRACQVCGMMLPFGTSNAAHLQALRPAVDLPVSCPCGRSFVEPRALEQHQRFCSTAASASAQSAKPAFAAHLAALLRNLCPCCDGMQKTGLVCIGTHLLYRHHVSGCPVVHEMLAVGSLQRCEGSYPAIHTWSASWSVRPVPGLCLELSRFGWLVPA
ncbi:ZNF699 [Symbiodinium natans]|uniref:ZNF699 protein n=1 Tax=Symbiodinium natans TaxID=878477 RepID=A0A812S9P0_9DINO|nr:ZNF699 [Symbiodinium natans]